MIVDKIFEIAFALLHWLISWLPLSGPPIPMCTADTAFGIDYQWIGSWVNLALLLTAVKFSLALRGLLFVPKIAIFVYRLFPLKGS